MPVLLPVSVPVRLGRGLGGDVDEAEADSADSEDLVLLVLVVSLLLQTSGGSFSVLLVENTACPSTATSITITTLDYDTIWVPEGAQLGTGPGCHWQW